MQATEPSYLLRCRAVIVAGHSQASARQNLIKRLALNEDDVDRFFQQELCFERRGLDAFTVKQYEKLFAEIGLEVEVCEETEAEPSAEITQGVAAFQVAENVSASNNANLCPKCFAPKSNLEQCDQCGIYFAKYHASLERRLVQAQEQRASQRVVQEQDPEEQQLNDLRRARTWLSAGVVALTLAYTLDDTLSGLFFLGQAGIDIGYLPYLLGAGILAAGSSFLMRARGYPWPLGLLAISGALGLGLLMLLPDRKNREDYQLFSKMHLLALVLIGFGASVFVNKTQDSRALDEFVAQAQTLRADRAEYPTDKLDDLEVAIARERKELEDYIDQANELLSRHSFRPQAMESFGEALFSEMSRLLVWLQYQRYLHLAANKTIPQVLDQKHYSALSNALLDKATNLVLAVDNTRLTEIYQRWFEGSSDYEKAKRALPLSNALVEVLLALNETAARQAEKPPNAAKAIAETPLPKIPNARIDIDGDKLMVHFLSASPFVGEPPLVLAYYQKPITRWNGTRYFGELKQINGDFPNKHLMNHFRVFSLIGRQPLDFQRRQKKKR